MTSFLYVVESSKPFDETVNAVEQRPRRKDFAFYTRMMWLPR